MGIRGPNSKPMELKILGGQVPRRAGNVNPPAVERGFPECPPHLTGKHLEAWERYALELDAAGVLSKADGTALEMLAITYCTYQEACRQVAAVGSVDDRGKPSGEFRTMIESGQQLQKLLNEFGMTPRARSKVQKIKSDDDRKKSPFERLAEMTRKPKSG